MGNTCVIKDAGEFFEIGYALNRQRRLEVHHTRPRVVPRPFLPQRARECEPKYESNASCAPSTRALRDRRLNSLYRRIIANENIGCAGITNGRGADEMHDQTTFRPISSAKNILWVGFLLYFKIRFARLLTIHKQSAINLHIGLFLW